MTGTRTLVVSRPENASGYQKLAWRGGHEALVRAEQSGWRSAVPFLYAHGAGQSDIAHGLPGDNLTLLFHFPVGKDAYRELVSKPGLRAFVTFDRLVYEGSAASRAEGELGLGALTSPAAGNFLDFRPRWDRRLARRATDHRFADDLACAPAWLALPQS
jgi:hypothetical protein